MPGKEGMPQENRKFMQDVATVVKRLMPLYGIKAASPIIAQIILESGWGKSKLAKDHHNYCGITASATYTGKKVDMPTKEEINGQLVSTTRAFRAYDSMGDGIRGYFEVISAKRYENLKGVTDPEVYIDNIIADGYCTASTYKTELMKLINTYNLRDYDNDTTQIPEGVLNMTLREILSRLS